MPFDFNYKTLDDVKADAAAQGVRAVIEGDGDGVDDGIKRHKHEHAQENGVKDRESDIPLDSSMNARERFCYITAKGENEKRTALPKVLPKERRLVIHTDLR